MNHLNSPPTEEDWMRGIKKELLDDKKDKETLYNFDFEQERSRDGRLIWERVESSSTVSK